MYDYKLETLAQMLGGHLVEKLKGKPCKDFVWSAMVEAEKFLEDIVGVDFGGRGWKASFTITYKNRAVLYVEIKRKKAKEYRRYYESQFDFDNFIVKPCEGWQPQDPTTIAECIALADSIESKKVEERKEREALVETIFKEVMEAHNIDPYELRKIFGEASHCYKF